MRRINYLCLILPVLLMACSKEEGIGDTNTEFVRIQNSELEYFLISKGIDPNPQADGKISKEIANSIIELDISYYRNEGNSRIQDLSDLTIFVNLQR